jgi:hypothetical protein
METGANRTVVCVKSAFTTAPSLLAIRVAQRQT